MEGSASTPAPILQPALLIISQTRQLFTPVHDGLADGQVSLDGDGQGHVDGGAEGDGGHRVQEVDVETRE